MKPVLDRYSGLEKRKYPRSSVRVIYSIVSDKYLGNVVYTKDISEGGLCFVCEEQVAENTKLSLNMMLPDGSSFDAVARVLRSEETCVFWKPRPCYQTAVEFTQLNDDDRAKVLWYINRLRDSKNR